MPNPALKASGIPKPKLHKRDHSAANSQTELVPSGESNCHCCAFTISQLMRKKTVYVKPSQWPASNSESN